MSAKTVSAEKPPRIKGLVKRCRSFKEDFMSRLARNRSLGKDDPSAVSHHRRSAGGGSGRKGGGGSGISCHSEGTSPIPPGSNNSSTRRTDTPDSSSSQLTISHRIKEANLTLSFVESLIQKNCIDLLGGSSNVMLDLVGNLLNEIKKTSISDSATYQSAISLVKSALTEFLTSVDILLLLKHKYDSTQQKLYFEKVLETLNHSREAISKLKNLIESKENGHHHSGVGNCSYNIGYTGSTPTLLTSSTPTSSISGTTVNLGANKLLHSPGSRSTGEDSNSQSHDTGFSSEDKRPPLPPKLKHWTAKSFDNYLSSSPPSTSPIHHHRCGHNPEHRHLRHNEVLFNPPSDHTNSTSLLSQWLEDSSLSVVVNPDIMKNRRQSTSSVNQQLANNFFQAQNIISSATNDNFGSKNNWTDSAIFVSNSNRTSSIISSKIQATVASPSVPNKLELRQQQQFDSSSQYSEPSGSGGGGSHLQLNNNSRKLRTLSDSFYGRGNGNNQSDGDSDMDDDDDDESGENVHLHETRSHCTGGTTSHCSQSLSIGSSLDNLLLVDSNSTRSAGMSPNSQRISVSSNTNTHSPLLLAGTNSNSGLLHHHNHNYDPDLDGDVFLNETENNERLVIVDQNEQPPPELPKKMKPGSYCSSTGETARHFMLGSHAASDKRLNGNSMISGNDRCPSPYDNVDSETLESLDPTTSHQQQVISSSNSRQFMSYSESRHTLVGAASAIGTSGSSGDTPFEEKPPLPPKKKHSITAYVELLHSFDVQNHQGQVIPHALQHHQHFQNHRMSAIQSTGQSCSSTNCGSRGSVIGVPNSANYYHFSSFSSTGTSVFGPTSEEDTTTLVSDFENHHHHGTEAGFQYQQMINPTNTSSFESDTNTNQISNSNSSLSHGSTTNNNNVSPTSSSKPPVLPPKKSKQQQQGNTVAKHSSTPEPVAGTGVGGLHFDLNSSSNPRSFSTSSISHVPRQLELHYDQSLLANELCQSELTSPTGRSSIMSIPSVGPVQSVSSPIPSDTMENLQPSNSEDNLHHENLYLLDVSLMLIKNEAQIVKGSSVEGPDVKGADPIILLIYAASPYLEDAKFREVFLLTYRTFIPPLDTCNLLWKRYQYFERRTSDRTYVLHSRSTLDLFVDVINSLTPMDLDDELVAKIRECIYYLINAGELLSALKARRGLLLKFEVRYKLLSPKPAPVTLAVTIESHSLLQWSATCTAQQMTLLDSELFRHLEPAELLLWAREQSEDFCPALNNFTDHFNKVSYWARSRVLLCANSRERNRTMKKLIEVMRKLREYNNFNSLLAVLAALDSAPIRRLGFSKRLTEALKPHAVLTDSSGSFRTYRQALSESKPPCIPYIGLVLQDLTFVHIGNADFLADGKVNWIKRWQQWIVLEPIRRFHSCQYGFVKNDSLLAFLNNFDESLNDDDLWQLSEAIKPRGKS